jgi:putative holliday junction resolvase
VIHEQNQGRLAGIDYGTVRIGIAVTDREQRIASPFENYTRRGEQADAAYFRRLVEQEQIERFVVGLPVFSSGDESPKSREARVFGEWLGRVTARPVEYFDERYTTVEAEALLLSSGATRKRRKAALDKLAAQMLLTAYLESHSRGGEAPRSLDDR